MLQSSINLITRSSSSTPLPPELQHIVDVANSPEPQIQHIDPNLLLNKSKPWISILATHLQQHCQKVIIGYNQWHHTIDIVTYPTI